MCFEPDSDLIRCGENLKVLIRCHEKLSVYENWKKNGLWFVQKGKKINICRQSLNMFKSKQLKR